MLDDIDMTAADIDDRRQEQEKAPSRTDGGCRTSADGLYTEHEE
jgi:hypothetical protein